VEVELVDGDDALLTAVGDRLAAAGAHPSASASKLGRVLADRLAALDGVPSAWKTAPRPAKQRRKATKKGKKGNRATAGAVVLAAVADQVGALQAADLLVRTGNPDGVHDLRVACRRLRSLFAAFRPVLDREVTDPLRVELKRLGAELSAARDGQVALDHLRALVEAQPPELVLGPVAARVEQAAVADAEAGRKAADRALGSPGYLALLDDLFALLERPPFAASAEVAAEDVLGAAVRRAGKKVRRRIERAREGRAAEQVHEVRKAAKRARYTAEVAVGTLGSPARALRDCMEQVQEVLGERQDTVVTRKHCRCLGLAAFAAGENAWTYGRLHALEQARAERAEEAFWRLEPEVADAVRRATKDL
jgi:CHAD domain-containing protein